MRDWYMESGEYTSVDSQHRMAWSDSQSAWCELGSTDDTTPVWWRRNSSSPSRELSVEEKQKLIKEREIQEAINNAAKQKEKLTQELKQETEDRVDLSSVIFKGLGVAFFALMTFLFGLGLPEFAVSMIEWSVNEPNKLLVIFGLVVEFGWVALFPSLLFVLGRNFWKDLKKNANCKNRAAALEMRIASIEDEIDSLLKTYNAI